jgi:hypothetical protein
MLSKVAKGKSQAKPKGHSEKNKRAGFLGELTALIQDVRAGLRQGVTPISKTGPKRTAQRKPKDPFAYLHNRSIEKKATEAAKVPLKNSRGRRTEKRASEKKLKASKAATLEGQIRKEKEEIRHAGMRDQWRVKLSAGEVYHPWSGRIEHMGLPYNEQGMSDLYDAHPILWGDRFFSLRRYEESRKHRDDSAYSSKSYTPTGVVRRDYNVASKGLNRGQSVDKRVLERGVSPKGEKEIARRKGGSKSKGMPGSYPFTNQKVDNSRSRRKAKRAGMRSTLTLEKVRAKRPVLPKPPRGEGSEKGKGMLLKVLSRKKREVLTGKMAAVYMAGLKEYASAEEVPGEDQFEKISLRMAKELFQA